MEPQFNLQRPEKGITTPPYPKSVFQPLPAPTGKFPYHLDISNVIPPSDATTIAKSKQMIFHLTGDVGGVKSPQDQILVAEHMEMQFDKASPGTNPLFLYLAGDIVYYYGQLSEYNNQFFEPYKFYPAPILAIPGNHDGDIDPTDPTKPHSLDAFVKMFCSPMPVRSPASRRCSAHNNDAAQCLLDIDNARCKYDRLIHKCS